MNIQNVNASEHPDNLNSPYKFEEPNLEKGFTYFPAPQSNSTMVSDSVIMTQRLKAYVPKSSVQKGRKPIVPEVAGVDFGEEDNRGNNYKPVFR